MSKMELIVDRKRLEGGKAVLSLPKGSYIITVTNDSGKAVQSDEFTVNVDAVTKITIDKTDTYMNVGMTEDYEELRKQVNVLKRFQTW